MADHSMASWKEPQLGTQNTVVLVMDLLTDLSKSLRVSGFLSPLAGKKKGGLVVGKTLMANPQSPLSFNML